MDVDDDAALMTRWQAGDESAFDLLVEKYQRRVLGVAYRFLLDHGEAEDVAQEAFLRLYQARDRYQPRAKFSSFLFTIVNRLCFNALRHRRRHPTAPLADEGKISGDPEFAQRRNGKFVSAAQDLEGRERQAMVLQAIKSLSPDEHMAVVLDHWEDMPLEAIAEVMHKSVPAVKSLLFRARARLRSRLAAYFSD